MTQQNNSFVHIRLNTGEDVYVSLPNVKKLITTLTNAVLVIENDATCGTVSLPTMCPDDARRMQSPVYARLAKHIRHNDALALILALEREQNDTPHNPVLKHLLTYMESAGEAPKALEE